jgi:Tol biopolymer transport system component
MKLKALLMTVVAVAFGATLLAQDGARERKLQQAIDLLETKGDVARAMPLLEDVAKSADQSLAARGLLYLGQAQERQGNAQARATYERIIREFGRQEQVVAQARARLVSISVAPAAGTLTVTSRLLGKIDRPAYALGTMSRDGRYFPILDDKDDLWLFDISSGTRRLLIPKDKERNAYVEGLVFSPDGKLLAYATYSNKTDKYELRLGTMAAAAKDSRSVLSGEFAWIDPRDLSPDGTLVLANIQRETRGAVELVLVSTRDGSIRSLASPRPVLGSLRAGFSFDGRFIAADMRVGDTTGSDIAVFEVNGPREASIVKHRAHDVFVGWSPDGSRVIFASDRAGANGLWAQRVRNGEADGGPELIRTDIGRFDPIGVSSSGAVYSSEGFRFAQVEVRTAHIDYATGQLVESDAATGAECTSGSTQAPDYSADGKYLAFVCIRRSAGRSEVSVVIKPIAGGPARELRPGMTAIANLRWIPQAGALLVGGLPAQGVQGWWRMDALTGELTVVSRKAPDAPMDILADVSQDGRKAYFRRTLPGGKERALIAHDFATHEETELFRGLHEQQFPEISGVSPDGRYIYFRRVLPGSVRPYFKAEFGVKDVVSGTERIVISGRALDGLSGSPDGRYFATGSNDEATKTRALIRITIADGTVRELMRVPIPAALERADAPNPNPLGVVGWSPDSRALLAQTQDVGKPTQLWSVDISGQRAPVRLSADWKGLGLRMHPDGRQVVFTNRVAERVDPTEIWVLEGVIK